jgi:hypothetical protein
VLGFPAQDGVVDAVSEFTLPLAEMARWESDQLRADGAQPVPLPPLDGGRIAVSLLPHAQAYKFAQLERWGFPILLVLLFTGVLGAVMNRW